MTKSIVLLMPLLLGCLLNFSVPVVGFVMKASNSRLSKRSDLKFLGTDVLDCTENFVGENVQDLKIHVREATLQELAAVANLRVNVFYPQVCNLFSSWSSYINATIFLNVQV